MPINFHWQFKTANVKGSRGSLINNPSIGDGEVIDLIKDMVDLPSNSYTINNDESVLTYRALTEADYGYVYCWAENEISKQKEACRFEVSIFFSFNGWRKIKSVYQSRFCKHPFKYTYFTLGRKRERTRAFRKLQIDKCYMGEC